MNENKIVLKFVIFYMRRISEIFKLTLNYVRGHICLSMYCEICEIIH